MVEGGGRRERESVGIGGAGEGGRVGRRESSTGDGLVRVRDFRTCYRWGEKGGNEYALVSAE
jgi:hypothetical protein